MEQTLLEIVQHILSSMDSDEVNSITDTVESLQVANVVKGVYIDIVSRIDLPERYYLFELNASGDADLPIIMYLPDGAQSLLWVKYDNQTDEGYPVMKEVCYQPFDEYLKESFMLDATQDNVDYLELEDGSDTFTIFFKNDAMPTKYTTYNDRTILFDSFVLTEDDTLVKSKTMCYGKKAPTFTMDDDFTPVLDTEQFSLLINKAKKRAFTELKQTQNIDAMEETRAQLIHQQRTNKAVRDPKGAMRDLPNYGRNR